MINLLFPYQCVVCQKITDTQSNLCTPCYQDLPWITHACQQCSRPLPDTTHLHCGDCLKHPHLDPTIALFQYQEPIKQWIIALKFHKKLLYAPLIGQLMAERMQQHYQNTAPPQCLIPVPLHNKRLGHRGFNQAIEIIRPIKKKLRIPIEKNLCRRKKNTPPQSQLPFKARKKNMRHAFKVHHNKPYRHVALIDDVITSGHTSRNCAHILHKMGIARVDIWACARGGS